MASSGEIVLTASVLRDMIRANLLSPAETVSVTSLSEFGRFISRKILDRVAIMLEEQHAYPAPTAQHTILRLLPLLDSQTRSIRHLAKLLLADISADVIADCGVVKHLLYGMMSDNHEAAHRSAVLMRLFVEVGSLSPDDSFQAFTAIASALEGRDRGEELVTALKSLLVRCPSLVRSKAATSSIPHLVRFLSTGSEADQRSTLDCLFLLTKKSWSWANCRASSGAIPPLQKFMREGPEEFKEKAGALLTHLPGTLKVTIKGATHLRQKIGGGKPKVYCKVGMEDNKELMKRTGVAVGSTAHWDEQLEWGMDIPPIGKVLQVSCKNTNLIGKRHFGRAFVRAGPAVMLGSVSGDFTLLPKTKSGINPAIDEEIKWEALCTKKTNWEEYIV